MGLSRPQLNEPASQGPFLVPEPHRAPSRPVGPGPIVLFGAPGVGKGTQADSLAKRWGVPKISTGDILRAHVTDKTQLGNQANRVMKRGGLVPDQIVTAMVADRLALADTENGFILDGFPRTIQQAQWLDAYLSVNHPDAPLAVVNLRLDRARLIERLISRRVCLVCKAVYNLQSMPPREAGRCDRDGSPLEQRIDDRFEVCEMRLDIFQRETEPLVRYYQAGSLFIEIDAAQPAVAVTRDIVWRLMNRAGVYPERF
jgi:adenylate kinase